MSTRGKLIKARLGMLAFGEELQNIKLACKRDGVSHSHFFEIIEAFEGFGRDGLVAPERRKPRMPNRTPPELEKPIEAYPTYSYICIIGQLRLMVVGVSPSTVRAVCARHGLALEFHRLL